MQSELFKIWLKEQNFKSKGPVYDALFRCRKVERCLKVDLDCEFKKDQCRGVIRRLTYSVADDIAGVDAGLCGFFHNKPNYNDEEWSKETY